jgi:hypothetical protein
MKFNLEFEITEHAVRITGLPGLSTPLVRLIPMGMSGEEFVQQIKKGIEKKGWKAALPSN